MTINFFSRATKIAFLALACIAGGGVLHAQVFPFPIPSPSDELNLAIAAWMQTNTVALNAGGKVVNTAKYGPIEYSKSGTGPVVLCMHGGPGGYDQSSLIGEHLIAQGFTVIGVSRPGYLRTPLLPGTNDTIKLQAGAMIALLDDLGIKQAASLGFSAGSIVAFQMALDYPDRIFATALEGIGVQSGDTDFYQFMLSILKDGADIDLLSYAIYFDLYNLEDSTRAIFLSLDTDMDDAAQLERDVYVAANQKPFYFRFANSLLPLRARRDGLVNDILAVNGWGDYLTNGDYARITVPMMIAQSRNDTSGNYTQAVDIASHIPRSQLVSIDGAGHFSWMGKNTAAWETQLAAFLHQALLPRLTVATLPAQNKVTISWTPTGGRLQTSVLASGPWTEVSTNNPAAITMIANENRFYRVVNP